MGKMWNQNRGKQPARPRGTPSAFEKARQGGVTGQETAVQVFSSTKPRDRRFYLIKSSKQPLIGLAPFEDEEPKTQRNSAACLGLLELEIKSAQTQMLSSISQACCFPGRITECHQIRSLQWLWRGSFKNKEKKETFMHWDTAIFQIVFSMKKIKLQVIVI